MVERVQWVLLGERPGAAWMVQQAEGWIWVQRQDGTFLRLWVWPVGRLRSGEELFSADVLPGFQAEPGCFGYPTLRGTLSEVLTQFLNFDLLSVRLSDLGSRTLSAR